MPLAHSLPKQLSPIFTGTSLIPQSLPIPGMPTAIGLITQRKANRKRKTPNRLDNELTVYYNKWTGYETKNLSTERKAIMTSKNVAVSTVSLTSVIVEIVAAKANRQGGISAPAIATECEGFSGEEVAAAISEALTTNQIVRMGKPGPNGYRGVAAQFTTPALKATMGSSKNASPFAALNRPTSSTTATLSYEQRVEAIRNKFAKV